MVDVELGFAGGVCVGKLFKNVLVFCLNALAAYSCNEFIDECFLLSRPILFKRWNCLGKVDLFLRSS